MTLPDGLRAVAALLVIFPHSVGLFASWPTPTLPTRLMIRLAEFGGRGVQIFFVLSGFVIAYTLKNKNITLKYSSLFIIRRSIRLDPPYWAGIVLYWAFLAFRRRVILSDVKLPSGGQLVSHVFYTQDILGYGNINPVFWTLCLEVQFYVAFCLTLGVLQKLTARVDRSIRSWDKLGFVLIYFLSLAWPLGLLECPLGIFIRHWYGFLLGAIAWWVIEGSLPRWVGPVSIVAPLMIGIIKFDDSTFVVACTAALILFAASRQGLYRWLDLPVLQFIGLLSYSIYLIHLPVCEVMMGLQTRLPVKGELISFVLLAVVVLATIGLAFLFNRLVEVPSLILSHRLKARYEGGDFA